MFDIDQELLDNYNSQDLEYKVQAREILVHRLGYEPPLRFSALSELVIREKLKKQAKNEELHKPLDEWVNFQVRFVNRLMMEKLEVFNC